MLKVSGLYAGYNGQYVVKNISFTIEQGSNLVILGPNGCGKTTLLRAIAGLIPAKGQVAADELNIFSAKRHQVAKKIALMSQMPFITFGYTVRQAVEMGRYVHRKVSAFNLDLTKDNEIVDQCLVATGLTDICGKSITQLSGGQLQRVFLARTLCQQPDIILLDEPTNHMDIKHQCELLEYLKQWSAQKNHTVIGVMHDLTMAMQLADNAILMQNGSPFAQGNINQVLTAENLNTVFEMNLAQYMTKALQRWEMIK